MQPQIVVVGQMLVSRWVQEAGEKWQPGDVALRARQLIMFTGYMVQAATTYAT